MVELTILRCKFLRLKDRKGYKMYVYKDLERIFALVFIIGAFLGPSIVFLIIFGIAGYDVYGERIKLMMSSIVNSYLGFSHETPTPRRITIHPVLRNLVHNLVEKNMKEDEK